MLLGVAGRLVSAGGGGSGYGGSRRRGEGRLTGKVRGVGVGAEVVVEGDVFAEDDDDVLDGRLRRLSALAARVAEWCSRCRCLAGVAECALAAAAKDEGRRQRKGEKFPNHFLRPQKLEEMRVLLIVRCQIVAWICELQLNAR